MSLHQRGKIWHAVFYINGKQKWESLKTDNEKKAKLKYARRLIELTERSEGNTHSIEWDEFVKRYRDQYCRVKKGHSTNKNDIFTLNFFEIVMDIKESADLTPSRLREFQQKRSGKVTNRTINRQIGLLRNMGRWGQGEGYILKELDFGSVTMLPEVKKRRIYFQENEIQAIKKALPDQPLKTRLIVSASLYSGMRSGEIRHLKVKYFDFANKTINITAVPGWHPKDGEERDIPLYEPFSGYVREWVEEYNLKDDDYVFAHYEPDAKPSFRRKRMNTSYFNDVFKEFLKEKAKINHGTYYSGRHTFATFFDGDIGVLQQILGHADPKTTMIYKHNRKEAIQRAALKPPY